MGLGQGGPDVRRHVVRNLCRVAVERRVLRDQLRQDPLAVNQTSVMQRLANVSKR